MVFDFSAKSLIENFGILQNESDFHILSKYFHLYQLANFIKKKFFCKYEIIIKNLVTRIYRSNCNALTLYFSDWRMVVFHYSDLKQLLRLSEFNGVNLQSSHFSLPFIVKCTNHNTVKNYQENDMYSQAIVLN